MMRIAIKTLGCKSNRYESDTVFDALKDEHEVYELNEGPSTFFEKINESKSDLLIVNTCTVTRAADRKSRQVIRGFKRLNPNCKVVVFGCASNIAPKEYGGMREVDFRAAETGQVIDFAREMAKKLGAEAESCFYEGNKFGSGLRTRALVKIQEGCNSYCSYCIIPFTRGKEVSFSKEKILEEVQRKEKEGYLEIVFTGINIGEWKNEGMILADLFEYLIVNTSKVRFRISSIEPKSFSEKLFGLFATGRLCPHMHMSLQAGSDGVLKRMRRNYDTEMFAEVCERFRKAVPNIAITTDIIIGFPGESEKEFKETYEFAERVNFSKIHVFPYSRRKNTAAYRMPNQVSPQEKKLRSKRLRLLSDKLEKEFRLKAIGEEHQILVESVSLGKCRGLSQNYLPVEFENDGSYERNTFARVKIESYDQAQGVLRGTLI